MTRASVVAEGQTVGGCRCERFRERPHRLAATRQNAIVAQVLGEALFEEAVREADLRVHAVHELVFHRYLDAEDFLTFVRAADAQMTVVGVAVIVQSVITFREVVEVDDPFSRRAEPLLELADERIHVCQVAIAHPSEIATRSQALSFPFELGQRDALRVGACDDDEEAEARA